MQSASNRCDTTTWKASPARICSLAASTAAWCSAGRAAPGEPAARPGGRTATVAARGRGQLGRHPVQPGDGVVVGLVDALVAGVPVDRVGDQRDGALVVVDRGEVGRQQHHQLGQLQVVDGERRQPLHPAHHVVAEVADQPAGQRRQPRQRLAVQLLDDGRAARPAGRRRRAGRRGRRRSSQRAVHARSARPRECAPTNDQRDQERPFSADSSRNVPGRSPASLR